jgi:hypothetical protein
VGGQIATVKPSQFTLPRDIIAQARQRPEIRMGVFIPLLATFRDERYLIPAGAYFFKTALHTGADVSSALISEPEETEHRKGLYCWADDCSESTTYGLCSEETDIQRT